MPSYAQGCNVPSWRRGAMSPHGPGVPCPLVPRGAMPLRAQGCDGPSCPGVQCPLVRRGVLPPHVQGCIAPLYLPLVSTVYEDCKLSQACCCEFCAGHSPNLVLLSQLHALVTSILQLLLQLQGSFVSVATWVLQAPPPLPPPIAQQYVRSRNSLNKIATKKNHSWCAEVVNSQEKLEGTSIGLFMYKVEAFNLQFSLHSPVNTI